MADDEDRAKDTEFLRRVERVKKAFEERKVVPYRATVKALLEETHALDRFALVRRLDQLILLRKKRAEGFDGLEPVVCGYLMQMNRNLEGIDQKALADLQENPDLKSAFYNRSPLVLPASPTFCNKFWEQWVHGGPGTLPPGSEDGFIPCLERRSNNQAA
jgi:hypothetical protein